MEDRYLNIVKNHPISSIDEIQRLCYSLLPNEPADCKFYPWKYTFRGTAIYDEEFQCNCYMVAYAQWHKGKLDKAFSHLPKDFFLGEICVIDWGCGQGLGTAYIAEYIREHHLNCNLKEAVLIEPSGIARARAVANVKCLSPYTIIRTIGKTLDDVSPSDVKLTCPRKTLNIFSNILDVKGIDLKHISELLSVNNEIDNYVSVVGPYLEARRIQAFLNYFKRPYCNFYAEDKTSRESVSNDYTYIIRQLCLRAFTPDQIIHYTYFPSTEFCAAYTLDSIYDLASKGDSISALESLAHFDVYAPFDLGASVYDDIHPILAVLHNIISRGIPTKASPYVEQTMSDKFQKTYYSEYLGGISYLENFSKQDEKVIEKILSEGSILHEPIAMQMVYTPLAIARMQSLLVEILLTNRLDWSVPEWNFLVQENDVPFSEIAIEDFRQMFERLTDLSQDFSGLHLPHINLDIISNSEYYQSPLHSKEVFTRPTPKMKAKTYDFVLNYYSSEKYDDQEVEFNQFKVRNDCYFVVFSKSEGKQDRYIYTTNKISYNAVTTKDSQGYYHPIDSNVLNLRYFLNLIFRKIDFRPGQLPILTRALSNNSVIGLLPTGGGKSLTYQLAAMLQPGIAIVVDPLTSLMKDQCDGLHKVQIDCCTYINSTLPVEQRIERESLMEKSMTQFVFLSPERLAIYTFRQRLKNMQDLHVYFSYGVIDEVHCVSEWGHDFRYSYLHLGRNLYKYVLPKQIDGAEQHISLFGLTATASFDVLSDVERELTGNGAFPLDADAIIRYENTNRLELQYRVVHINAISCNKKWDVYRRKNELAPILIRDFHKQIALLQQPENIKRIKNRFIERENITDKETIDVIRNTDLIVNVPEQWYTQQDNSVSAIVFCPHRQGSLGVFDSDNNIGMASSIQDVLSDTITNHACRVSRFRGGDELSNQDEFLKGETSIMVATKAFGMGIDKPNVRFTLNVNHSGSLEAFVQEAGRAGRDRKMALATIMYCDKKILEQDPVTHHYYQQPVDFGVHQYFFDGNFIGADFEKWVMFYMMSYNKATTQIVGDFDKYDSKTVSGFIETLLSANEGERCVYYISYDKAVVDLTWINAKLGKNNLPILRLSEKPDNPSERSAYYVDAVSKAIYRMCCIGVIDDYTQDYSNQQFRIEAVRRKEGEYYKHLKSFLMRYFTEERAELEMQNAYNYPGQNEIQKCLSYITEFVYSKIAQKRYRAIRDMEDFCSEAISQEGDWLEINENLKDYIYYYFNSKFAREGYTTEKGIPYSLTDDTDKGKKSSWEILFKYLNVVDDDVIGTSGSPKDNIKHLQGAIRLIRRSLTDSNPTLELLNVYCLLFLNVKNNQNQLNELKESYIRGYVEYKNRSEAIEFFNRISGYKSLLMQKNAANESDIEQLEIWDIEAELKYHLEWTNNFVNKHS